MRATCVPGQRANWGHASLFWEVLEALVWICFTAGGVHTDAGARFGKEQHGDKEGIRKYFLALTNEARLMSL